MILLDTSMLVASLAGQRLMLPELRKRLLEGPRFLVPTLVLFEWRRGPRTERELTDQETLFPSEFAVPFEVSDAFIAAKLYRQVRRARGREIDLAIAACAIAREAELWTLNRRDFEDIPGLVLAPPS